MAPVVRVEPCKMKLLDSNPELSAKVQGIGWMPFISKFSDSNPEVTRVFALSLVDYQAEVGDLCLLSVLYFEVFDEMKIRSSLYRY